MKNTNRTPRNPMRALLTIAAACLLSFSAVMAGDQLVIPDTSGGYGATPTLPDRTTGYGGQGGQGVHIPDTTTGYGQSEGYGGYGGQDNQGIHIPDITTGYGQSEGYGGYGGQGNQGIHIPDTTTGYGQSDADSGYGGYNNHTGQDLIIPDRTTGYGAPAPAPQGAPGTVVIPDTTQGYGVQKQGYAAPQRSGGPYLSGPYQISGVTLTDINTGAVLPIQSVDLRPTINRIASGQKDSHRNDGTVYRNLNELLPRQPQGYYREYVVRTPGVNGPGPQRLIIGQRGEKYYTPDHYDSFVRVE